MGETGWCGQRNHTAVLGAGSSLGDMDTYLTLSKTTASSLVVFSNLPFGLGFLSPQSLAAKSRGRMNWIWAMAASTTKITTSLNDSYPKLYLQPRCPYSRTRGTSGGPRKYGLCPKIEFKTALHDLEERQQEKQVWPAQTRCPRAQPCSSAAEKVYAGPSLAQMTSSRTKYRPDFKSEFLWFWFSFVQLIN